MSNNALYAAIRESFGRVVYTHKTHEKAIDRLNGYIIRLKWLQVVLMALTTTGLVTVLFGNTSPWTGISALFSAASLGLSIHQLSFKPTEAILGHRKAADALWGIRERYINLLTDISDSVLSDHEIRERRDQLVTDLEDVYSIAPDTLPKDYEAARKALKINEEMTFTDQEIDQFLPTALGTKQSSPNS